MASNPDHPHFGIIAGSLITSALALYYGTGLHPTWWLTWLAPFPLLLIVPRLSLWRAFGVSVLASFAGGLNMWHYFRHTAQVPLVLIVIFLLLPACIFALGVLLFRLCALRGSLLQAAIVYPAFWVSFEFFTASVSLHSTYGNLAYNQMNFLPILQIASVTGIWGISFCVLLFPATIAAICVVPGKFDPRNFWPPALGSFCLPYSALEHGGFMSRHPRTLSLWLSSLPISQKTCCLQPRKIPCASFVITPHRPMPSPRNTLRPSSFRKKSASCKNHTCLRQTLCFPRPLHERVPSSWLA